MDVMLYTLFLPLFTEIHFEFFSSSLLPAIFFYYVWIESDCNQTIATIARDSFPAISPSERNDWKIIKLNVIEI